MKELHRELSATFTRWYVKQGYTFGYDSNYNAYYVCPWYVRPLLTLFSPSVYYMELFKDFSKHFSEALKKVSISLEDLVRKISNAYE